MGPPRFALLLCFVCLLYVEGVFRREEPNIVAAETTADPATVRGANIILHSKGWLESLYEFIAYATSGILCEKYYDLPGFISEPSGEPDYEMLLTS